MNHRLINLVNAIVVIVLFALAASSVARSTGFHSPLIIVAMAVLGAYQAGRNSASLPRSVTKTVTISPSAEGEGLAVFVEEEKVGTWTEKDGAAFALLKQIHENPRHPELWMRPTYMP